MPQRAYFTVVETSAVLNSAPHQSRRHGPNGCCHNRPTWVWSDGDLMKCFSEVRRQIFDPFWCLGLKNKCLYFSNVEFVSLDIMDITDVIKKLPLFRTKTFFTLEETISSPKIKLYRHANRQTGVSGFLMLSRELREVFFVFIAPSEKHVMWFRSSSDGGWGSVGGVRGVCARRHDSTEQAWSSEEEEEEKEEEGEEVYLSK